MSVLLTSVSSAAIATRRYCIPWGTQPSSPKSASAVRCLQLGLPRCYLLRSQIGLMAIPVVLTTGEALLAVRRILISLPWNIPVILRSILPSSLVSLLQWFYSCTVVWLRSRGLRTTESNPVKTWISKRLKWRGKRKKKWSGCEP